MRKAYPNSVHHNMSDLLATQPSDPIFSIESNSTISGLIFNQSTSKISFAATGSSGTAGYAEAKILENLMPNAENIKVHFHGNEINYTLTSDGNLW